MFASTHLPSQAVAPASAPCHEPHEQILQSRAKATAMNEDGVYELSSGRTDHAIVCLETSVNLLLQLCQAQRLSPSAPLHNTSDGPRSIQKVQIPYLQDELFYLYPHAITYEVASSPAMPTSDLVFDSSVVLFNLALAYHQKAIARDSAPDTNSLRQALVYYQESQQALQSLQTLQRQTIDTGNDARDDDDDLIVFLKLAAMNNQSQILYQYPQLHLNAKDLQESFQTLLQLSMKAMDEAVNTHSRRDQWSMVEVAQIQDFVQNAMVFRLPRPCVAPAA